MQTARKIAALVMTLVLTAPVGALQQDDPRFRIRTTVELVVVPVTVKDGSGNPVHDISREEFRIFEDGVEQQISLFSVDPFPLSAVVLIDNGLQLKPAEQVQQSIPVLAAGFSEFDEVAISLFEAFPENVGDFTTDNDKIHERLKRIELAGSFPGQGSGPMTAGPRINAAPVGRGVASNLPRAAGRGIKNLDDAVFAAAQMLHERARDRRKIILLISDGANSRNNAVTFDDTLKLLLSYDISVYAIGVGDAVVNRVGNPLARYARLTGGDIFYAATRAELESLYSRATEEARNQYTLAYVPANADRSQEFHSIEVRVRRPNLTLSARDGYYRIAAP